MLNKKIEDITNRIILRSEIKRKLYLSQMLSQFNKEFSRAHLNCGNLAHAAAGSESKDKAALEKNIVHYIVLKVLLN